ncbi:TonB-dependent receptor domain-containing protein [Frigoriflavimonas asaccharolytica]|uniref:Outer membrane protein beta-barrel domain-containing protein n=1 Tax=Frigoriflavimonas asaccharolytica TaxID=2735899 RepID=A0A8J8K708_9FLAO|nr:TonB-dependent receptor [Frigoriflavimonas asaccharolytica]NRS91021.1 hypothetical protein [Frigoriflavimonas asaccharolytica]
MNSKNLLSSILLLSASFYFGQEKPVEKSTEKVADIEAVTITKTKKAVEQKADRTIFDFSEQAKLNSGTLMEGVKKLPGLVVTDIAGMMYQGKILEVYMDGRPLNINSTELTAFLEGMPANAVEKIEVITQPGAEFPATSGGAILNIITSKNAKNYLSATYSGNYTFTNYDKWKSRTNNSINLNARNKYFGWQLNVGENYRESLLRGEIDDISKTNTDRIGRGYFAKAAITVDLGKDRLLLNYDIYHNNNDNYTLSNGRFNGINFQTNDAANSFNIRQEAVVSYQKRFEDRDKKLDFKGSYSNSNNDFAQNSLVSKQILLDNTSHFSVYNFKVDYNQALNILEKGKFSIGALAEQQDFDTSSFGITNLDYKRQTLSAYTELQTSYKKFDFILGTRAENYDISGTTVSTNNGNSSTQNLIPFQKFKLFPNASILYNVANQIQLSANYNKKINLPSISNLNPNNTTFQNPNSIVSGNPNLQPTIFDNYEVKLSAFDYAFIGYNVTSNKNQVAQLVSRSGDVISNTQINIPEMQMHNFNVGLPIPLMLFTKPLSEIMKFEFNPDKINFVYLYASWQKQVIPNLDTKGYVVLNANAQILLPKEITLNVNYFILSPKGNFYYFQPIKPIGNNIDITLSKKFLADKLSLSIFANDIFNSNVTSIKSIASAPNVFLNNKNDSRSFGLSVNYKLPTKNKLAKEDPNLLNKSKSEGEGGLIPAQ